MDRVSNLNLPVSNLSNQCDSKQQVLQSINCDICLHQFTGHIFLLKHYLSHEELNINKTIRSCIEKSVREYEVVCLKLSNAEKHSENIAKDAIPSEGNNILTYENRFALKSNLNLLKEELTYAKNQNEFANTLKDTLHSNNCVSDEDDFMDDKDGLELSISDINNDKSPFNLSEKKEVAKYQQLNNCSEFVDLKSGIIKSDSLEENRQSHENQLLSNITVSLLRIDDIKNALQKKQYKENIEPFTKVFDRINEAKDDKKIISQSNDFEAKEKEKVHQCDSCSKVYTTRRGLLIHLKNQHKTFRCRYCSLVFDSDKVLKKHIEVHNSAKSYNCGLCSAAYFNLHERNRHARKHFSYNEFKCDICGEVLQTKQQQSIHFGNHFKWEASYKCDLCNSLFSQKQGLKVHIEQHLREEFYYCKVCLKSFKYRNSLIVHKRTHSGGYKCNICHKTYTKKSLLEKHKMKHTANPYACKKCNASFPRNKELLFHQYVVHAKKVPFKCTDCDKLFISKCHLSVHMRVHTGKKQYLCSYCGKHFFSKAILQRHTLNHIGVKNYQCDYCKNYFVDKSSLERHIMQHTGYKPYVCQYCGKGCTEMGNLNQHIRTHTKEKPISCKICGKGFLRNSFLYQHMEKVHSEVPRQY